MRLGFVRIAIVERHSAVVTDVLRFAGVTHGRIETSLTMFRRDCADLYQVRSAQFVC